MRVVVETNRLRNVFVRWASALLILAAPQAARSDDKSDGVLPIPSAHPPEISNAARDAIAKGLEYLAAQQNRDGSWRSHGGSGTYPVAMGSRALP